MDEHPRLCIVKHYINGEEIGEDVIAGQEQAIDHAKELRDSFPHQTFKVFAYTTPIVSWTFGPDDDPRGHQEG